MKPFSLFLSLLLCLVLPSTLAAQSEEFGKASYYSDDFQGRATAYGDTYNKNEMTCAHKRHPYGSVLRVTRLDNGQSVRVRVIDKGPFIQGRVVDLSRRAAEQLGMIDDGLDKVDVKVTLVSAGDSDREIVEDIPSEPAPEAVDPIERPINYDTPQSAIAEDETPTVTAPAPAPAEEAPSNTSNAPASATNNAASDNVRQSSVRPANDRYQLVGEDFQPYGLYRIVLERPTSANYGVQVASLSNYQNVLKQVARLQAQGFDDILVSIEPADNNTVLYKVVLGPFDDESSAQAYRRSLRSRYSIDGFVVDLESIEY